MVFLHLHKRGYPTHSVLYGLYTGWYSCTSAREYPTQPFLYGLYAGWYSCTSTRDSTLLILFIDCTRGGIPAPPQETVPYSSFLLNVHQVVFLHPQKRVPYSTFFCMDCTRGGIPAPPQETVPYSSFLLTVHRMVFLYLHQSEYPTHRFLLWTVHGVVFSHPHKRE